MVLRCIQTINSCTIQYLHLFTSSLLQHHPKDHFYIALMAYLLSITTRHCRGNWYRELPLNYLQNSPKPPSKTRLLANASMIAPTPNSKRISSKLRFFLHGSVFQMLRPSLLKAQERDLYVFVHSTFEPNSHHCPFDFSNPSAFAW